MAHGVYFELQGLLLVFLGQLLASQSVLFVLLLEFRIPYLKLLQLLRSSLVQYLKGGECRLWLMPFNVSAHAHGRPHNLLDCTPTVLSVLQTIVFSPSESSNALKYNEC